MRGHRENNEGKMKGIETKQKRKRVENEDWEKINKRKRKTNEHGGIEEEEGEKRRWEKWGTRKRREE